LNVTNAGRIGKKYILLPCGQLHVAMPLLRKNKFESSSTFCSYSAVDSSVTDYLKYSRSRNYVTAKCGEVQSLFNSTAVVSAG
jgi:hypothetical protein